MNAADYRPQYDTSVYEILPGATDDNGNPKDTRVSISQAYCLMPTSAQLLATLFSPAPTIYMAPPIPQAPGSPFVFNHPVPWLKFQNGNTRNAALLASWWGTANGPMPGVPYGSALDYANQDVATPVEG